jgi:hypothetical protein
LQGGWPSRRIIKKAFRNDLSGFLYPVRLDNPSFSGEYNVIKKSDYDYKPTKGEGGVEMGRLEQATERRKEQRTHLSATASAT